MGRNLHLGCFDQPVPGWVNTDVTPHVFLARVPGMAFLLKATGLLSEARYRQHRDGIFRQVRYLDVTKRFPYPDRWFDCVYSSHLLEHLYPEQAASCLAETRRVLVPGGVVRIAVPDLDRVVGTYDPLDPDAMLRELFEAGQTRNKNRHHWGYNEASLFRLLGQVGFRDMTRCSYRQGRCTDVAVIDIRPESLAVEAVK